MTLRRPSDVWADNQVTLDVGDTLTISGNVTVASITNPVALKGNMTIDSGVITTITNPVALKGNLTINSGTITAVTDITNPVALKGNVTLDDGSIVNIGGTNKTLVSSAVAMSTGSLATLAVPTGTFKITSVLFTSNASVKINILSGTTHLNGNASIGVYVKPGSGWAESGSVDAPVYIGAGAGQGIVIQKRDMTATVAEVSGKVIYYE